MAVAIYFREYQFSFVVSRFASRHRPPDPKSQCLKYGGLCLSFAILAQQRTGEGCLSYLDMRRAYISKTEKTLSTQKETGTSLLKTENAQYHISLGKRICN